jgi:hypothetical protein
MALTRQNVMLSGSHLKIPGYTALTWVVITSASACTWLRITLLNPAGWLETTSDAAVHGKHDGIHRRT